MNQNPFVPEANPWWWNPSRPGMVECPEWFAKQLHEVDPILKVVWNNYRGRWQVWAPSNRVTVPMCRGWLLLFPVEYPDHSYCPLDERTLAKIYSVSAQHCGGARQYWNRVEGEIERDRVKAQVERANSVDNMSGDYWDYLQPKVSMAGPSNGSKCSNL